jgi:hypothetical protein
MVIDLELRRVQAKFSGHLYLAVRQMPAPSRVNPCLHFLIRLFDFLRHTLWYSSREADSLYETGRAKRALLFLVLLRQMVFTRIKTGRIQSSRSGKHVIMI